MFVSDSLSEYHPIACNQWGFQPGRLCVTTLLTTTYNWYRAMENGKDVVFDFQKAFDSVPREPLIIKLQETGLHHHLISYISSELSDQQEPEVVVNGLESETIDVISSVAQGSVLGPLLFLINMLTISVI